VARHPQASAFHQRSWLQALASTYGYQPLVLTSAPAGKPLCDGVVLCRVASWITKTRLVSLPFSDHCEPLQGDVARLPEFLQWLEAGCDGNLWSYVELRPLSLCPDGDSRLRISQSYYWHTLDLSLPLEEIFRRMHKNSIQRRIRRGEREGLTHEVGRSDEMLDEFYRLLMKTRRRHRFFPQPRTWFRNLIGCVGNNLQIRLARKNGIPIAALLTLRHRSSVIYKYGCSDQRFHHLAGMPFLFWRLIEESKASGADEIDLGRSDLDNLGLITFKDRLGARKQLLRYYRYSPLGKPVTPPAWALQPFRQICAILPDAVLRSAGRILYKHLG